jgi:hypothetical protein
MMPLRDPDAVGHLIQIRRASRIEGVRAVTQPLEPPEVSEPPGTPVPTVKC